MAIQIALLRERTLKRERKKQRIKNSSTHLTIIDLRRDFEKEKKETTTKKKKKTALLILFAETRRTRSRAKDKERERSRDLARPIDAS